MSMRYTNLCKQMQKTAAVLLSSGMLLQSCNMGLEGHNMDQGTPPAKTKGKRNVPVQNSIGPVGGNTTFTEMNDSTGRGSMNGFDSEGVNPKKGNSKLGMVGVGVGCFLLGAVPFGVGFGVSWGNATNSLSNANGQNDVLSSQNTDLLVRNAQLTTQLGNANNLLGSSLSPSATSVMMSELSTLVSDLGANVTVASNTPARLLTVSGPSSLSLANLANIKSITIPGNIITPYTANGASILNATNTVLANTTLCPTTGSTGSSNIVSAVTAVLNVVDTATIAANAANSVTYDTAGSTYGTSQAVLNAIIIALPNASTTDPGYMAGVVAQSKSQSTQATVVAAIVSAAGPNALSSIAALAVQSIMSSSFGTTYTCSGSTVFVPPASCSSSGVISTNSNIMLPSSISSAVNGAIGVNSPKALAASAVANMRTTLDPTTTISYILEAINTAMAASGSNVVYTWNQLGLPTDPTLPLNTYSTTNGFITGIGINSILPAIVSSLGANSIPAMVASAIINSGIVNPTTGLIANTATDTNVNTAVLNSDPVLILANQASNLIGSTCTTTNNAVLKGLSMLPYSNYIASSPTDLYKSGRLTNYFKYLTGLTSVSITGKTLSYPPVLDLTGLNNLDSFTLNSCVVNNEIILPTDLSSLSTTNSTLCYGGGLISNANGANLTNPGFINATVNSNAINFNTQTGTGPLCPGNIGSIPTTGLFSTVDSYSKLFNTCQSNLKGVTSMVASLQNATSQAITGANNCLISNMNLTNYLNNYVGTLNTCINKLQPLASNPTSAQSAVSNYCVGTA